MIAKATTCGHTCKQSLTFLGSKLANQLFLKLSGELMNVTGYKVDSANKLKGSNKESHKSDPELYTIPNRIKTFDKSAEEKSNRQRSNTIQSVRTKSKGNATTLSKSVTLDVKSKESTSRQVQTMTMLMGGQGYIQWRASDSERNKTSQSAQKNKKDAHLVIWDHRLLK